MEPESHDFEGHRIEIRGEKDAPELLIDNVPVRYRRMPDGSFALDEYAYDRTKDLVELARRFIRHRRVTQEIREKNADQRREK